MHLDFTAVAFHLREENEGFSWSELLNYVLSENVLLAHIWE